MSDVLSRFLEKLRGAEGNGKEWKARCPAHEDHTPSLSISEGDDGRVLLKCFAGCSLDAVCGALGITKADLFPRRENATPRGKIVAEYPYTDAQGNLMFQVVRLEPKSFRQRRPDPNKPGSWIWDMKAVRRVLYRLPEVRKALASGQTVYLVEGEKDVAAMVQAGFAATCNPGGAGKWTDDYTATLNGADVVIIADKDKPGREHAELVASKLHGHAERVRVIELPDVGDRPVKDAADFFAAGGTAEELRKIVESAPEWTPNAADPEPDGELPIVELPSGETQVRDSARKIFTLMAPSRTIFYRGGALAELISENGVQRLDVVKPDAFKSRVEKFGRLFAWRSGQKSEAVLKPSRMNTDQAKALMAAPHEILEILPAVSCVLRCPMIVEGEGGKPLILEPGYHMENGGILIVGGSKPPKTSLEAAVGLLKSIIEEFSFQSEGDRSRAIAAIITPALRIGGFLKEGRIPIDVAEANESQTGKGHRHKMICAVYNEESYHVTPKSGGVGSFDESLASALIAGRPFICFDNLRGKIDSPYLESFITCPGLFPARTPGRPEVLIDAKRFNLQLSSNGIEATPDLANRCSICRILKRPGYAYRDTLGQIVNDQPLAIGSVFRVIREWMSRGKPRTNETRHDFREWCQVLDWIVQNVFQLAPLMDGHRDAQKRVSKPALAWLRSVAIALEQSDRLGHGVTATDLALVCIDSGLEIPGAKMADEDSSRKQIGIVMKPLFSESDTVSVDGFTVTRGETKRQKPSGDWVPTPQYEFSRN